MSTLTATALDAHAKKYNIFINETRYVVTQRTMTGRELKALAEIPEANQIFLDVPGDGDDVQVFDDAPFEMKSGMKFFDIPVGNLGLL